MAGLRIVKDSSVVPDPSLPNDQPQDQRPLPPLVLPSRLNEQGVQLCASLLLPIVIGVSFYNYLSFSRLDLPPIGLPVGIALGAAMVLLHAWWGVGDLRIDARGVSLGQVLGPHRIAWTEMDCLKISWIRTRGPQIPQVVIALPHDRAIPITTHRMPAFTLIETLSHHAQAAGHPVEMCITDHDQLKKIRYRV